MVFQKRETRLSDTHLREVNPWIREVQKKKKVLREAHSMEDYPIREKAWESS